MKKTSVLITSLCALGAAVAMAAGPVSSVNAVGYYTVSVPSNGQFVMVGSPFDPIGGDTNVPRTVLDVFGTNSGLRTSTVRTQVDRVYVWDVAEQKYLILGQKTNGVFAVPLTAPLWNVATNPVLPRGFGVWIQSISGNTNPVTVTLMGQVPTALTNALDIHGAPGAASPFQMVVNPYPVATTLDELINTNNGAFASDTRTLCDRVWKWNELDQRYETYGLKASSNRWFFYTSAPLWSSNIPPVTVDVGEAFWYVGKMTNFTWKAAKTYQWP